MATTGYQIGPEANNASWSYGKESAWGTNPSGNFQAIRFMSETLSDQKSRTAPGEITPNREAFQQVTTQEQASGDINYALSYGTYDDFFASLLGNTWQAAQTIAGISGDITITTGTNVLSSTLSTKFQNINAGQWIKLAGFSNTINNGFFRVVTKTDNSHLVLTPPYNGVTPAAFVTETPTGSAAQVRASTIMNGTSFNSLYLQKQFSSALFMQYPGAFVSQATLGGQVGDFFKGAFSILAQQEISSTSNVGGTIVAAPSGSVHNTIGGFKGFRLSDVPIAAVVDSFSLTMQNVGAANEFAMGAAASQGLLMGQFTVSGSLSMFFKDFTYYSQFKNETFQPIEMFTSDLLGNTYVITILNGALMNPKINASGPNQPVKAVFNLEGSPQSGGGTLQIDRLPYN